MTAKTMTDPLPLVSLIVPCYCGEKTVVACLDSVRNQTYGNVEVVFVNDASKDNTAAIVQDYQEHAKLNLVCLSHEKNQGVSAARNHGIEAASGEYLAFLDADDRLDPGFCETLVAEALQKDLDIVACNISKGQPGRMTYSPAVRQEFSCGSSESLLRFQNYFDSSCAKIYRKALLVENRTRFHEDMRFGEDTLFANTALLNSKKVGILGDYAGYEYLLSENSCTVTIQAEKRLKDLSLLLRRLHEAASEKDDALLLRKSKEFLWTIQKFGKKDTATLLQDTVDSELWNQILFPVIAKYGKPKHRLILQALKRHWNWTLRFW